MEKEIEQPTNQTFIEKIKTPKYIISAVASTVLVLGFTSGFKIIETGNAGIKSTLGKINPIELEPGLNWAAPIFQKIEPIFTKTVMVNYTNTHNIKEDTEEINYESTLRGEDVTGLDLGLDLTVEVSPVTDKMADMYIEVGRSGFDKKVLQTIRSVAREVMSSFKAEEIMGKRAEVQAMLDAKLRDEFSKMPYYEVTNVQLKKIYLPQKVKDAIERVQIAKQEALEVNEQIAKNQALAKSKEAIAVGNANALKTEAQGKADAVVIEAEAEAQSIKLRAEAQAIANKKINESLTELLVRQNAVIEWGKGGSQVPRVSESIPFIGTIDSLAE